MKKTMISIIVIFIMILGMSNINAQVKTRPGQPFTDTRDGTVYQTVKIGTQTWMAQNLAFNGRAYKEDKNYNSKYGCLYNWDQTRHICPSGWHLPTDGEWTTLTDYLGGEDVAGKKLKSTSDWKVQKGSVGTNSSGFNAKGGGTFRMQTESSPYGGMNMSGRWWTATPSSNGEIWIRYIMWNKKSVKRITWSKSQNFFSVRCIKND